MIIDEKQYFYFSDIGNLKVFLCCVPKNLDLENIEVWVHEFVEETLFDLISVNFSYMGFSDTSFFPNICFWHIITSLTTKSAFNEKLIDEDEAWELVKSIKRWVLKGSYSRAEVVSSFEQFLEELLEADEDE